MQKPLNTRKVVAEAKDGEAVADMPMSAQGNAETTTDEPLEETDEVEAQGKTASVEEVASVATSEPTSEATPEPATDVDVPANEGTAEAGKVRQLSAPVAPMALAAVNAGETVMAIQLYSGQVHTNRMDMVPVLDFIEAQKATGKPVVRIEGSASDGPSSRAGGNMELASSRAMDVYLRVVGGLADRGLEKGRDYEVVVVRRVQPDGDTPASFVQGGANPASFQYVRVDVAVR